MMGVSVLAVMGFIVFLLVLPALFIMTLHATLLKVEKQHRTFFPWLVWLMLIPGFGYFFSWYFLLAGIPNTLKKAVNEEGLDYVKKLFYVGLGAEVVPLFVFFSFPSFVVGVVSLGLFIAYWRMAHVVGKKYLRNPVI